MYSLPVLARKGMSFAHREASRVHPATLARRRRHARLRAETEAYLAELRLDGTPRFEGRAAIDGMFDNPNYWMRLAMFRAAAGLTGDREVAMLGPYNRSRIRRTLDRFGVARTRDFVAIERDQRDAEAIAGDLVRRTHAPGDILDWELPEGVPAGFFYDGLLRRQRAGVVDIAHPRFARTVTEAVAGILGARDFLDTERPDMLVLSHHFDFRWSALVWMGFARGIPSYMLFGNYGVLKPVRMSESSDIYDFYDRPLPADLDAAGGERGERLRRLGRRYMDMRLSGRTTDLGAVYAFQSASDETVTRESVCRARGWDSEAPIVAIYVGNWWDNIHGLGMANFRDLPDWLHSLLPVIRERGEVNWLIKGHPADRWYGGTTLADIIPNELEPHIHVVSDTLNNADIIEVADACVTIHGTAGVEFAARGKPVLLADRGWYHDCGLALRCHSRAEFLERLSQDWWREFDGKAVRRRAEVFAGLCYGCPDWQGGLVFRPDTDRDNIYEDQLTLLRAHPATLERELRTLSAWIGQDERFYHRYKMRLAESFMLPDESA